MSRPTPPFVTAHHTRPSVRPSSRPAPAAARPSLGGAQAALSAQPPAQPRVSSIGSTSDAPVFEVLGETVAVRVTAAQTGGAYAVFELTCRPGAGTPPHRESDDEVLLVIEGELTLMVDWREYVAGPGTRAFVPRGTPHAYRNRSAGVARVLVISAPGGPKEALFAALDAWARAGGPGGGPPDVQAVRAICAAHGVELLTPR